VGYGIKDRDFDITPSSVHMTPDTPSSFIRLAYSDLQTELCSEISNMDSGECIQIIEQDLEES